MSALDEYLLHCGVRRTWTERLAIVLFPFSYFLCAHGVTEMTQNVYEKILVTKTDMDGALSIFLRHIHDKKKGTPIDKKWVRLFGQRKHRD